MIGQKTIATAAVLAALSFAAGWKVCAWRQDSREAAKQARELTQAIEDRDAAIKSRDEAVKRANVTDNQAQEGLKNAQAETNRLRDCLRNGSCGLRVAAKCPPVPASSPAASGAIVDHGTAARLDSAAESAYFALRDGIDQQRRQLEACQARLMPLRQSPGNAQPDSQVSAVQGE